MVSRIPCNMLPVMIIEILCDSTNVTDVNKISDLLHIIYLYTRLIEIL